MFLLTKGHIVAICVLVLISLVIGIEAYGFGRRRKWAWYCAWVVGVLALVLVGWIIWGAAHASQYGDGSEAAIIGVIMLGFAIGAWWVMLTSELEEFLHPNKTRMGR
jgi:hypothetical protein